MTVLEPVPIIGKRKSLSKENRTKVFDAAGGICHICGLPIKAGEKWEAEHPQAHKAGGSDQWQDMKPAHAGKDSCHARKTAEDVKAIAKGKRVRAKHLGIKGKPGALSGRSHDEREADRRAKVKPGRLPLPTRKKDIFGNPI